MATNDGENIMNGKTGFTRIIRGILLGLMLAWLTACTSGPRVVDHAFSFDARWDSPGIEVLNYQYGSSNMPGTHIAPELLRTGQPSGGMGINGPMPIGDTLYVKWRIKATGEVFEESVDLKRRLPWDITDHRIYFIVGGPQLYVYLVGPDRLNPNPCPSREDLRRLGTSGSPNNRIFAKYCNLKIVTLYPDHPQSNKTKQGE